MTDIYDIKQNLLGLPINIVYSIFFLIFIIFLIFLYKFLENNKNNRKKSTEGFSHLKVKKINFSKISSNFEEKYLRENKTIFYSKLLEILREIYKYKNKKDIWKLTFDEINKLNLDNNLKLLIKNLYFKEYSREVEDSEEVRKKLILEVREII